MTAYLTSEARTRLAELFFYPGKQESNILDCAEEAGLDGIVFGRVPGVRLWYWGERVDGVAEISRVWPDDPFTEAA
ncbi:hypothetical protein ABT282_08540 [Streptomyces sp. NPDC000927]|uniref:hypothetical protein n=1 Tax=Streptomyces sp. NPDC000927 TaxID=3154371 RepID=UPI0033196291